MFKKKKIKTNVEGEKVFSLNFISDEEKTESRKEDFAKTLKLYSKITFLSEEAQECMARNELLTLDSVKKFKSFSRISEIIFEVVLKRNGEYEFDFDGSLALFF